jgi:hypothetical protein
MKGLILQLVTAGIPALIEAITDLVETQGKEKAVELRDRPLKISVSFGGGEGEAVVAQREVEAKLPDGFTGYDD